MTRQRSVEFRRTTQEDEDVRVANSDGPRPNFGGNRPPIQPNTSTQFGPVTDLRPSNQLTGQVSIQNIVDVLD